MVYLNSNKFDFVELFLQLFSFALGILLIFLVSGISVHAAESATHTAPNGQTYEYYYPIIYKSAYYYTNNSYKNCYYELYAYSHNEVVGFINPNASSANRNIYTLTTNMEGSITTLVGGHTGTSPLYIQRIFHNYDGSVSEHSASNSFDAFSLEVDTLPFKLFDSYQNAKAYLQTGDTSGWLNMPDDYFETISSLDESMEIPRLRFYTNNSLHDLQNGYDCFSVDCFVIDNAQDNLFVQVKGSYNSIDRIKLIYDSNFFRNQNYQVSYYNLIRGIPETWIAPLDRVSSRQEFVISDISSTYFDNFLSQNPTSDRTFLDPDAEWYNASGSGEAAVRLHLSMPDYKYNFWDLYVRFISFNDDGSVTYSKWSHASRENVDSNGAYISDGTGILTSDVGLTDEEVDSFTSGNAFDHNLSNTVADSPLGDITFAQGFLSFSELLASLTSSTSGVIGFFNHVFSFLPTWCISLLGLSVAFVVVLRFIGR